MKNSIRKKILGAISSSLIIIAMIICSHSNVFAEAEDVNTQYQVFMEANGKYFVNNNMFLDCLRYIGWMIAKFLGTLLDIVEGLYKNSVGLLDFTNYPQVNEFIDNSKPLWVVLLTGSLIYLGYSFILAKEKKHELMKTLVITALCFISLGTIMTALNSFVISYVDANIEATGLSSSIYRTNIYDLFQGTSDKGFDLNIDENDKPCIMSKKDFKRNIKVFDVNRVVNSEDPLLKDEDIMWKYKTAGYYSGKEINQINAKKKEWNWLLTPCFLIYQFQPTYEDDKYYLVLEEIYNGAGVNSGDDDDLFNEFYYRYHINYLNIYIQMIAFIIVYIALSYKVVRVVFELAFKRILAFFYSADLNGVQKTMKILGSIKDGYIIILVGCILIKFFIFMQGYLYKEYKGTPTYLIFLIMTAFAVIDGPDIVQQITGIDAGLSGGVTKMLAAAHIGRGVARTATAPARIGGRIASNAIRDRRLAKDISTSKQNSRNLDASNTQKGSSNKDISDGFNYGNGNSNDNTHSTNANYMGGQNNGSSSGNNLEMGSGSFENPEMTTGIGNGMETTSANNGNSNFDGAHFSSSAIDHAKMNSAMMTNPQLNSGKVSKAAATGRESGSFYSNNGEQDILSQTNSRNLSASMDRMNSEIYGTSIAAENLMSGISNSSNNSINGVSPKKNQKGLMGTDSRNARVSGGVNISKGTKPIKESAHRQRIMESENLNK